MLLGEILRERGMNLALFNAGSWRDDALEKMREYIQWRKEFCVNGDLFGMDQFRMWALENGLPDPPSINAYGSLGRIACKDGLIEATNQYVKSEMPSAHRRIIKLWRVK